MKRVLQLVWLAVGVVGCGGEAEPPRPIELIAEERGRLPKLYLTEKSKKEVVAPGDRGAFVDAATGELCWPALICTNPDCPAPRDPSAARPPVFICPDGVTQAGPDGTITQAPFPPKADPVQVILQRGGFPGPMCPECRQKHAKMDFRAYLTQYGKFVEAYVLPESAARAEELDEEEKGRSEYMKERAQRTRKK